MGTRIPRALALLACLLVLPAAARAAAPVTYAGDAARTGWYGHEPSLTSQLVTGGTFGQLWSTPVNGQVYVQPLVSNGVLLVATETNWIYGLDPKTGAQLWARNVGAPFNATDVACADLAPSVGITGTPVVDPDSGTAYFFSKTYTGGAAAWYAHAVDVTSGAERSGFPVRISGHAQNNASTTFDAKYEMQRPALLLMDGVVYAAFGGHCDVPPYQGWVAGVSTSGQLKALWVARGGTNQTGAGIWQSGGGIVSDGPGRLIVATGNGGTPPVPTAGSSPPADLGEAVARLDVQSDGTLRAGDFFAPYDAAQLDTWDADFGAGGPVALPDGFGTAAAPHLLLQAGKQGYVYLLDRDHLGGIGMGAQGSNDVVNRLGPYGGVWSRPAVWPGDGGYVYLPTASGGSTAGGSAGVLNVFHAGVDGAGKPTLSLAASSPDAFGFGSSSPIVTSDGTASGSAIVWMIWSPNGGGVGAELRAYSALPASGQPVLLKSWPIGTATKFTPPGVAAGRLYVGTRDGHVLGFGSPVSQPLTGSALAFGTLTTGQQDPRVETLTATEPLTIDSIASNSPAFAAGTPSRALPATLATGDQVTVPVTFSPSSPGLAGGTLDAALHDGRHVGFSLSGNGQAPGAYLSVSPPAVSFGGSPVGGHRTGTVTVSNLGGSPMTVNSIADPASPFSVSGAPAAGSQIASGQSVTFDVSFDPAATGAFSDELAIDTSAGTGSVGLSGTASPPSQLAIDPGGLDFGTLATGSSSTQSFTLTNTGGSPLTITKSKPPALGAFTALTDLSEGTTIPAGGSVVASVRFAPLAVGTATDSWLITADDGGGPHAVPLSGSGALFSAAAGGPAAPASGTSQRPVAGPGSLARLLRLRVSPRAFSARARVSFELDAPARLRFAISPGGGLRARRASVAWLAAGARGSNTLALSARGRHLAPGRYTLSAAPAAGGPARHAAFRVVPKR